MTTASDALSLTRLLQILVDRGAKRVYAKVLAANDNSKNQPYFGGDFSVLNILPLGTPRAEYSGEYPFPIFKAPLNFAWLDESGNVYPAPRAQLIMYQQYPEVRFSGYLKGCKKGPSHLMGSNRTPGRILFLGVCDDGQILGYAVAPDSPAAAEFRALGALPQFGVFVQVPLPGVGDAVADRAALLAQLCRISRLGWISGKRLMPDGSVVPYTARNGGGYTLEAELGILPNSKSAPDYRNWEVKQHGVRDFKRFRGRAITLMTPEPTAGYYQTAGLLAFIERYGYKDKRGRADRLNFGGIHQFETECSSTGLTLKLLGYDAGAEKILDATGAIVLVDRAGNEAATWAFTDLMAHWNRKHATAAYVPSLCSKGSTPMYKYASRVRLGTGTDFLKFVSAVAKRLVYYDPGIKVESYPAKPRFHRRSQFRIADDKLGVLYDKLEVVDACAP